MFRSGRAISTPHGRIQIIIYLSVSMADRLSFETNSLTLLKTSKHISKLKFAIVLKRSYEVKTVLSLETFSSLPVYNIYFTDLLAIMQYYHIDNLSPTFVPNPFRLSVVDTKLNFNIYHGCATLVIDRVSAENTAI